MAIKEKMPRNTSKHVNSLSVLPVVKWVLVVGLLSILGMAYLLYQNQIKRVANDNKILERQLRKIEEGNNMLRLAIARLKAPRELQRRVAGMGLISISELPRVNMNQQSASRVPGTRISAYRVRDAPPPGQR